MMLTVKVNHIGVIIAAAVASRFQFLEMRICVLSISYAAIEQEI